MSAPIEVRLSPSGDPMSDPTVIRGICQRYLIWDAFVAGARRVDLHPIILSDALHQDAVATAERAIRILSNNIAKRAFQNESERARYGFHNDTTRLVMASHQAGDVASVSRVDLLLGRDLRWHVCEVNADCPGGYNESVALPKLARAAGYVDGDNPTHCLEALVSKLTALATCTGDGSGAVALTYATAYSEDLQVCALLRRMLEERGVRALLTSPTVPNLKDGVLCVRGEPVSVIYRYFPTEYMEGQRNLDAIEHSIRTHQLRTVASFAEMYAQSKLVMARAWSLRETLDEGDARFVAERIPETFDSADVNPLDLMADRAGWVLKRTLGRVGDDVFVGSLFPNNEWQYIVEQVGARRAEGERWIAQRFLPQSAVPTPWGDQLVTLGAYVFDGKFAGYYARITPESHVSHDALCLPVFAERAA